ncbi:MAG TPA: pyridoxamine 5'-phosphate oxidase family protein [Thermoanaerobaculia bacterium]
MDERLVGLGDLLARRQVAALGTLHDTAPYVSMVPFALLEDGSAFLIHVSELSAHTQDMLTDPRVSLLVMEGESAGTLPQELARVTVLGEARRIDDESPEHEHAMARYLERFPDSAPMFGFADFSLFAIRPAELRWIGGFAAAQSLTPGELAEAVRA